MHSVLPRAYLAPLAMGYLGGGGGGGGYYDEVVAHQSYASLVQQSPPPPAPGPAPAAAAEEPYPLWEARSPGPRPLDLSLKPPAAAAAAAAAASDDEWEEAIEVDDEEDRRSREEARSQHSYRASGEVAVVDDAEDDDRHSQRSCSSSVHSSGGGGHYHYPQQQLQPYHHGHHHQAKSYQQHLLRTPPTGAQATQMLQGTHALTPPSTPSPPQCAKRRDAGFAAPCKAPRGAKKKHVRKLKFDEDKSSPVSGTIILAADEVVECGDIDPALNAVDVSPEARAELAKIENKLGPYQCKLCLHLHEDAFQLAQHRCSRIVNVDYRCPECEKRFTCPANLASHRRWHKPKPTARPKLEGPAVAAEGFLVCGQCDAKFGKPAALKKHVASQHPRKAAAAAAEATYNNNNGEEEDRDEQQPSSSSNVVVDVVAMEVA